MPIHLVGVNLMNHEAILFTLNMINKYNEFKLSSKYQITPNQDIYHFS